MENQELVSLSNEFVKHIFATSVKQRGKYSGFHQNCIFRDFFKRILGESFCGSFHYCVMEEVPQNRYIIFTKAYVGEYAYLTYGMTAFEVYLNGAVDEDLSKIWRFVMRDYFGPRYATLFNKYAKKVGNYEKCKEEIIFLSKHYDVDPNTRIRVLVPCY